MAIAIVPEIVEEEADAWHLIGRGGWRIAAGVSLEQAEEVGIEVWLDFEKGIHLRKLDGAGGGLIADDGRKRRERALDDAGGNGMQTLETHDGPPCRDRGWVHVLLQGGAELIVFTL